MLMTLREQRTTLAALGLLYGTASRRRESWKVFQTASAWHRYRPGLDPLTVDGIPGPATTAHARVAVANGGRISPSFRLAEFRCTCRGRYHSPKRVKVDRELIIALERARARLYGSGLTIVCGWRCTPENRRVGGQPDSAHLIGKAADIPPRHGGNAFKGLGFHGIEVRKTHGRVTHVDIHPKLNPDHIFYV